ncbi:MAG: SDR family oxidoreductase [Anaerolineae bacterium]|nr:SDR family oxidoreductase [Anaerolineae bacterium]
MTKNPYSLEGKLVLVTGAGTGIGKGIALEVARQGADVVLSSYIDSTQGALEAVEEIKGMGRRAIAIHADLSKVEDCQKLVDEAVNFLGGLDGVVNNAGITLTNDFLNVTEEQFNRLYAVNIRGQFFTSQRAVRYMLQHGEVRRQRDGSWAGGSIVNISSVHGYVGCSGHSVYAGTKGAINAFSRELAVELSSAHIRVNVLAPGSIEVQSYFSDPTYNRELGNTLVPWGRIGLPQDCGYFAAYLLSDAAEFLTGQVLHFDGGLTAKMALPIQPQAGERQPQSS